MAATRTDPKYLAVLALACVLILLVGVLLRPRRQQGEAASVSVATDLLQVERIAQRQEVELISDYFAYVASLVEDSVVLLGATGRSGVIWQVGEVLTSAHLGPFPARDRTALGSEEVELTTRVAAPHLPFVTLEAPVTAVAADRGQVRLYSAGSWLLAVWRSATGGLRYRAGNQFGVAVRRCGEIEIEEIQTNLERGSIEPGAGIFSLDGSLIAVALDCGGELVAAEVGALAELVHSESAFEDRLMERFGMRVGQADERECEFFGRESGVLVRETWWGYRAHQAGLMPGDFLLVLDGTPVESLTDLQALTLPVSREVHELRIWRSGRPALIRLFARAATELAVSPHGFVGEQAGLAIESVVRGSFAEHIGARSGDRLLAINQRQPGSIADLEAFLRRTEGKPRYFAFQRRGRIWGILVQADE